VGFPQGKQFKVAHYPTGPYGKLTEPSSPTTNKFWTRRVETAIAVCIDGGPPLAPVGHVCYRPKV
jgi:hypothetical protein